MDTVADAGYIPMLYASRNALWDKWEMGRLSAYRVDVYKRQPLCLYPQGAGRF